MSTSENETHRSQTSSKKSFVLWAQEGAFQSTLGYILLPSQCSHSYFESSVHARAYWGRILAGKLLLAMQMQQLGGICMMHWAIYRSTFWRQVNQLQQSDTENVESILCNTMCCCCWCWWWCVMLYVVRGTLRDARISRELTLHNISTLQHRWTTYQNPKSGSSFCVCVVVQCECRWQYLLS